MSVTIYGHHDGDAIFEDEGGMARIPLRMLALLHHAADMGTPSSRRGRGRPCAASTATTSPP